MFPDDSCMFLADSGRFFDVPKNIMRHNITGNITQITSILAKYQGVLTTN
jgi:hypothetical protein